MYRARSGQRTRRSWGSPGWILCIYIYIYIHLLVMIIIITASLRTQQKENIDLGQLDTLQRGVQWEGGAVDGSSIM